MARAMGVSPSTVAGWESGRDPVGEVRAKYAYLLDGLAAKLTHDTAPSTPSTSQATSTPPVKSASPATSTPQAPPVPPATNPAAPQPPAAAATPRPSSAPEGGGDGDGAKTPDTPASGPKTLAAPSPAPAAPAAAQAPRLVAAPSPAGAASARPTAARRPGARNAARTSIPPTAGGDPGFANGPLAVIDVTGEGEVLAYCVGGLVLDVPAGTLPSLVEWTLTEAKLGAERLNGSGKDADPLLVLTPSALQRFGLPVELTEEERLAGRLPDHHRAITQLTRAQWQLTKRGLGPWARIYRPAQGARRACVQLCIPSWNALDRRSWGHAADLPPAELASVLGTYATRVLTPRGSTAVTGLELMTALHPPTRASAPDAAGRRHSVHNPGSLGTEPMDPAPCEATDGHPVLAHLPRFHVRGPGEKLFEEAYDWARPLTDDECMRRQLVGIDVNMAFAAGANGAVVGLATPPVHVTNPAFDPKTPGAWLADLSHVDLSRVKVGKQWTHLQGDLLPSPFTPTGETPDGPAWYATPTIAYAVELGYDVAPLEAWIRPESGRYLDDWYKRLRDAYVKTMADLGVDEKLDPAGYLAAMDGYKQRDPAMAIVLDAVKSTVKNGIGKFQEKARGGGWRPGQPWPALARPTWRPDIRAVIISRARINMHRKMVALAAATGRYPVAVLSDCAVYAADGPSPLDVLPYDEAGKTVPGSFRLGVSPGMVKHEGTQTTLWAEELRERAQAPELNLARYIKTGETTAADTGE
ncbi:telomere-associated protein Tap [Streptomyces aureus]|uniref:telomere-associated protein Tap n=1 Tax=Streptomyces aureus TaxID=193461 RepID=UPI003F5D4EF4